MGSLATPNSKFKVALIQMNPKPNDPAHNFNHAATEIQSAISENQNNPISLAILPEYHLTGFQPSTPEFIPACQTSHHYIQKYQTLARELQICICAGTIVLTPTPEDPKVITYNTNNNDEGPKILNTAYFISNTGEILGSYTKVNLWHPERPHLTAAVEEGAPVAFHPDRPSIHDEPLPNPHQVIDTPIGKVGILVCWDLAFPEAFRSLINQGAKIICVPTAWTEEDMTDEGHKYNSNAEGLFLQNALTTRAFENTCAVIFCNLGGPREEGFLGLSQVALPIVGTVKGSFTGPEVGVRVVDVDMEIVEVAERNYKIREDLAKSDWHYGYTK